MLIAQPVRYTRSGRLVLGSDHRQYIAVGRRRKAWLWGKTGKRFDSKKRLPGFYVRFNEYRGERRTCRSHCFTTIEAAREWVLRHNAKHDLRLLEQTIPVPLRDAVEEFISGCSALSEDTQSEYTLSLGMLRRYAGPACVCDIAASHLDRFVSERLAVSSPTTVEKHLRHINRFFVWAATHGYADINPVKLITSRPRGKKSRERPAATERQLAALVEALETEDRRLAVWLAMTTGLDRGVITALRAQEIRLEDRSIRVVRPKTGKVITAPIHAMLIPFLAQRLGRTDASAPLLAGLHRQERAEDWWVRATKAAGCPDLWFRDLRAVATSRLLRAGLSLTDAQRLLGHASPETTARHYHAPDPSTARVLNSLALPGFPDTTAATAS